MIGRQLLRALLLWANLKPNFFTEIFKVNNYNVKNSYLDKARLLANKHKVKNDFNPKNNVHNE